MSLLVAIRLVGAISSAFAFGFCTSVAITTKDPLVIMMALITGALTVLNMLRFGARP